MSLLEPILAIIVWLQSLTGPLGYLAAFLISFLGNATIFLPVPSFIFIFTQAKVLNPVLLGIAAGAGAALGELTGYLIGRGSGAVINKKNSELLEKAKEWVGRYNIFPILILFAATPLPDEIVGVIAGAVKYDVKKFLLASFIGKTILYMTIAFAGLYSIELFMGVLGI